MVNKNILKTKIATNIIGFHYWYTQVTDNVYSWTINLRTFLFRLENVSQLTQLYLSYRSTVLDHENQSKMNWPTLLMYINNDENIN